MNLQTSTAGRLLVAAICIAASQALVWRGHADVKFRSAQAAKFDVTGLPLELGPWSGSPSGIDPRLAEAVGALSMANRAYENETGRRAYVHVASFSPGDLVTPHIPDSCYLRSGWSILRDNWQRDSHDRRYRLMIVGQEGARVVVAYWFQVGPDVVVGREDLRQQLQNLRLQGKDWHAVAKVMIHIPIEFSEKDAVAAGEDLGARIYDWIKANS